MIFVIINGAELMLLFRDIWTHFWSEYVFSNILFILTIRIALALLFCVSTVHFL